MSKSLKGRRCILYLYLYIIWGVKYKMKKTTTISYFVVGLLLISSFAAIGLGKEAGVQKQTQEKILIFSEPSIVEKNIDGVIYAGLNVESANGCTYSAGEPILPKYATTLSFPFGTKILGVQCVAQGVKSIVISHKILPAPEPMPLLPETQDNVAEYVMDEVIYTSANLYPDDWFNYYTGAGLDSNGEHKTFLTLQAYPARYSPATDTVSYAENLALTITYQAPLTNPFPTIAANDLVIIAPQAFSSELQKLVTHKNNMGVSTILKTTEDIYSEFSGVDKPEQIKYFIKYALETWDIKYVLLVGGMKSHFYGSVRDDANQGTKDWQVPVRYSNNYNEGTSGTYDPGYISDLYYADIYNSTGGFDNWDSNGNGKFAEWKGMARDKLDLYPDVYLGRLTCRNTYEVKIMVNKIINYEKEPASTSWFNKMILIGGDSFPDPETNYYEGESTCDLTWSRYMSDFTPVRIYASYKTTKPAYTPITDNIVREITAGAGHLLFDGHGNPSSWSTHWPLPPTGTGGWAEGIEVYDFPDFKNKGKLPVAVVGGCHNSEFNVTFFSTWVSGPGNGWTYGQPIPMSFGEWLTQKIGGGAIAAMGNTGLGYGAVGEGGDIDGDGINDPDGFEAVGGYLDRQFYNNTADILGEKWGIAVTNYLNVFPGKKDQLDTKTVQEWPLIGDPSLKIGGYPAAAGLKAEISGATSGIEAILGETVQLTGVAYSGQAPYTYTWDLDEDGKYDDGTGSTASKSWSIPGVYWVSLKVTDGNSNVNTYDTVVGIEFGASTPSKPEGSSNTKVGETYTYTTSVDSTNWDKVYYNFLWGDGTESGWLETPSASHSWNQKGIYLIQVKALFTRSGSESVQESDSAPLVVSAPKVRQSPPVLLQFLEKLLERFPNAFPILRHLLGV
jgi:hypothetical protein